MTDHPLAPMTSWEITWGYPFGHRGRLPAPADPSLGPREALERVVLESLRRRPCGVAFSGGRDSSAVLAVATAVARREGLADPVPITMVFPEVHETDEDEWQERVIRHLGLRDWERVVIHDELDLVGPLAAERIREHGVVWPPTIHRDEPLAVRVAGGSLIDGEGGDEVLGVAAHRVAPVTFLLRRPRPLRRRRLRSAARALAPGWVRARGVGREVIEQSVTWLRPPAIAELRVELARTERGAPLSFAASVRRVPVRRSQLIMARNRRYLAARHGVSIGSPLLHPEVVDALGRRGGTLGPGDRTAALRDLVSDLLPDAVLSRTGKARFGGTFWGPHTRAFIDRWTGEGLDETLVDADELLRLWRSERRNALTAALLQAAWLAADARTSGSAARRR